MLKNLLVQYEGGGYDGCFWEYNHFFWDENGNFQNLVSTGYAGVKNEREALGLIEKYNSYLIAKDSDPVWGRYAQFDLTFVNILNRHSTVNYVDNYNASMVSKIANLTGCDFHGHCHECGDLLPVGDMYIGNDGKDFFCRDCFFNDDSLYIAELKFGNATLKLGDVSSIGKYGRLYYSYVMLVDDKILFNGLDYSPSPMSPPDSLDSLIGLLGFLTVKEGDTDDEYFKDYTDDQLEFTQSDLCEELSMVCYDYENEEDFLIVDEDDSGDMIVYTVSYKD